MRGKKSLGEKKGGPRKGLVAGTKGSTEGSGGRGFRVGEAVLEDSFNVPL